MLSGHFPIWLQKELLLSKGRKISILNANNLEHISELGVIICIAEFTLFPEKDPFYPPGNRGQVFHMELSDIFQQFPQ